MADTSAGRAGADVGGTAGEQDAAGCGGAGAPGRPGAIKIVREGLGIVKPRRTQIRSKVVLGGRGGVVDAPDSSESPGRRRLRPGHPELNRWPLKGPGTRGGVIVSGGVPARPQLSGGLGVSSRRVVSSQRVSVHRVSSIRRFVAFRRVATKGRPPATRRDVYQTAAAG